MNTSYIIATYAGKNHVNNGDMSEFVLQLQMEHLVNWMRNKSDNGIRCYITEIIIVCPPLDRKDAFENYYLPERWADQIDIPIRYIHYMGDNIHHSYDQWIQGWISADDRSDYYILIEDDYCIDSENLDLEYDLIQYYRFKFPDNIGYLATFTDDKYHGFHASISNGLVSKETVKRIKNPLKQFYNIHVNRWPQVNFSHLFFQNNIPISDFRDKYSILFWNSHEQRLETYSTLGYYHVFKPIQFNMDYPIENEGENGERNDNDVNFIWI